MTGPALYAMLLDLQHATLSPDDHAELAPIFRQMHAGEVVALPEPIIERVKRIHAAHC